MRAQFEGVFEEAFAVLTIVQQSMNPLLFRDFTQLLIDRSKAYNDERESKNEKHVKYRKT